MWEGAVAVEEEGAVVAAVATAGKALEEVEGGGKLDQERASGRLDWACPEIPGVTEAEG